MKKNIKPFDKPIYITRPILPDLKDFNVKLKEIWDSQWLTNNGRQQSLFEKELAGLLKVPNVSVFNNGTIALIVACQSLKLSGEVITTPFTFPATPHVLSWNNIKPVFCDIDPVTMNIDANKIEGMITPKTTAILGVHVFGNPCNVEKIQNIADRRGLKVVYDAAHAFGTEIDGKGIGEYGDLSMFSFHATKLFHTAEGGALAIKTSEHKKEIDFLKNFGIKSEEEVVMPGINGKMNEIQAALGLTVLKYIDKERKKRLSLAKVYRNMLRAVEGITLPSEHKNIKDSQQYFVIRIDGSTFGRTRDGVHDKLKDYNVFTRKYFYPLCSDYPCYKNLPSSSAADLPVAQKISKEVLSLPFYGGLSTNDIERICDMIKELRK
jgi:dTDP-4-amino-4,6-dideoxygalactose transaminase